MPSPHCPKKHQIDKQADQFITPRNAPHQHGRNKNNLYYVQVAREGPDFVRIWWTDKLHPHTKQPDFDPSRPCAWLTLSHATDAILWDTLKNKHQLALLIAAALERLEAIPWPS